MTPLYVFCICRITLGSHVSVSKLLLLVSVTMVHKIHPIASLHASAGLVIETTRAYLQVQYAYVVCILVRASDISKGTCTNKLGVRMQGRGWRWESCEVCSATHHYTGTDHQAAAPQSCRLLWVHVLVLHTPPLPWSPPVIDNGRTLH